MGCLLRKYGSLVSNYLVSLFRKNLLRLIRSGHQPTIDVLNAHAGVAALNHKVGGHKLYSQFTQLAKLGREVVWRGL